MEESTRGSNVEADPTLQQTDPTAEQIGSADLVVGILAESDSNAIAKMCDALGMLPGPLRIAVLHGDQQQGPAPVNSETTRERAFVFHVPSPLAKRDVPATGVQSMSETYQSVFAAAEKLQARGCCIVASKLEAVTPPWAWRIAQPLFESQADLVLPHYARRKFEGLLNASIIAPIMRALYGKRVNNPMGPDFGVSQRLFQRMLAAKAGGNQLNSMASLAPTALCQNLQIIEVHFGSRVYPATDWSNMSSVLADVLNPVFVDIERNAPFWQRIRVSVPVRAIGEPFPLDQDSAAVDTRAMVDSFQLGNRELQEIWSLVLPPSSLFELRKLSRLPVEQFRMPDELWVRIVYDFALAHRLRTISRDHLLRSMTPLYLGWVASYAHDLTLAGAMSPERRLERLSVAYEAGKSYLVSRWRWPDRFNP
jgi:glucosylglycerate synthase